MTKLATIEDLNARSHGIGWMETKTEGEQPDLCPCAWADGFILGPGGNVFCLEEIKSNYGKLKEGWGIRIWINSKPSRRQIEQEPWKKRRETK